MKSTYIFVNFMVTFLVIMAVFNLVSMAVTALLGSGALSFAIYLATVLTMFASGAIFRIAGLVLIPVNAFLGFMFSLGRRQTA